MEYPVDLLEHYRHPRHRSLLDGATHVARAHNPLCGDEVTMRVRVADGRVEAAAFEGVGCAISLGAADLLAAVAIGTDAAQVAAWDEAFVHQRIGMVPPDGRRRCATMGLEALQRALLDNHPPQGK